MNRAVLRDATIGLVYLVVVALLITLTVLIYNKDFVSYTTASLRVGTSGNALQVGSDVKVRGVDVGTVAGVTSVGAQGADVHLDLDPARAAQLPANVTGQLLPKTLFGEQYVSLTIPSQPEGTLHSGARIQPDTSPASIELQKLFDDLLPVLRAVRPDKLAATLGEFAAALHGPIADDIATLIQTLGPYLRNLAPHITTLSDDLDGLARVATTYTSAGPDIAVALDSFTTTSRTFVQQRKDYETDLRTLTSLGDTVGGFVGSSKQEIIGLANDSLPTLRTLAKYGSEFPCLARALVDYIPTANKAFGAGTSQPGAHVVLHVVPPVPGYRSSVVTYNATGGPQCPNTAATTPGNTTPAHTTSAHTTDSNAAGGMGLANSPQENNLIGELVAPSMGVSPSQVPGWASLLLGPALRGTQVSMR